jgi:hypothetical protein
MDDPFIKWLGFFPGTQMVEKLDRQVPLLHVMDTMLMQVSLETGQAQIRLRWMP